MRLALFRAYNPSLEPLGRLLVAASFDTRTRLEKGVKTGKPREVPIHPTLANVLAAWKLTGWRQNMGRSPGSDDCELLGLRKRRKYDSRRTFVSLAQVISGLKCY